MFIIWDFSLNFLSFMIFLDAWWFLDLLRDAWRSWGFPGFLFGCLDARWAGWISSKTGRDSLLISGDLFEVFQSLWSHFGLRCQRTSLKILGDSSIRIFLECPARCPILFDTALKWYRAWFQWQNVKHSATPEPTGLARLLLRCGAKKENIDRLRNTRHQFLLQMNPSHTYRFDIDSKFCYNCCCYYFAGVLFPFLLTFEDTGVAFQRLSSNQCRRLNRNRNW